MNCGYNSVFTTEKGTFTESIVVDPMLAQVTEMNPKPLYKC